MLLLSIFFFALGAILASFMLVIAERIYTGQSWSRGRSRCNSCARELTARDLVPVLSYVYSRGCCSSCGSRVPAGYVLAEGILGSLFLISFLSVGLTPALPFLLASLALLTGLVWYDLRHMIIPIGFSMLLLLSALTYAYLASASVEQFGYILMQAGGIGLFFFFFHTLSGGRAMGLGDAPLALALALIAGPLALSGLVYSFWVGGVIGTVVLLMRASGTRMNSEVPFAPFLAAGFLLALYTSWDLFTLLGLSDLLPVVLR